MVLKLMHLLDVPLEEVGTFAFVDEEDLPLVARHRWSTFKMGRTRYANTKVAGRTVYMHRLIMGEPEGLDVDHIDGNGLNNSRSNLRVCTHRLNVAGQRPQENRSSPFKGVCWYRALGKWQAYIRVDGKRRHLGYFHDEFEAAEAYDTAATEAWGEFARLNAVRS